MPNVRVNGMHCGNCQRAVAEAIGNIPGVRGVEVDLEKGEASWLDENPEKPADVERIRMAITAIGFDAP